MKAQITPSMDEFCQLGRHGNVVPVFAEFITDNETPVSAFKKLDGGGYGFLFESTEKNDESGRFSFVGIDPRIVIKTHGHQLQIFELGVERRAEITSDPLDELRKLMARYQFVSRPELPRFSGGAVGFLGYEAIHSFEPKVPTAERDELQLPEMIFMITSSLLIFDHRLRTLKIVANAFLDDGPLETLYAPAAESIHARLIGDGVEIRPLAGTRPRGDTSAQDEKNAAELLADPKERAEHIMLVDLARNDVGRVSGFGTVRVTELMEIERYSHVMHIVSNVTGHLRTGCTGFDLVKATFPAGTVSGAPKIRAMQIISELERTRRGCYAGAIGYFGFDGNVDSCIALRCAVLKTGKAYFQSGAGIVADSSPHSEYEETVNKARAMRKALAMATRITPSRRGECGCNASDTGDFKLRELTLRLMRGENLSRAEAGNFLDCLLNPVATDAQIAAALTSLAGKRESC